MTEEENRAGKLSARSIQEDQMNALRFHQTRRMGLAIRPTWLYQQQRGKKTQRDLSHISVTVN